jgi:esterase FrsA
VDTWYVELHRVARVLSSVGRFEVVSFDMPVTGECADLGLRPDTDEVYRGVIQALRPDRPAGVMGISFAGLWAAKLALLRTTDFAVDLGGPVGARRRTPEEIVRLPNGMPGILAHAVGLERLPTVGELGPMLEDFSLRPLLRDERRPTPLLAINGERDPYVPPADVECFRTYPTADVWLVRHAGHCAAERIEPALLGTLAWLRATTRGPTLSRALTRVAAAALGE